MSAEMILTNARIHTIDPNQPTATALAIREGKILAVGSDEEIKPLLASDGTAIDMGGRCVIPGLVDSHVHFRWFAIALQEVNLDGTGSVEEALARIEANAKTNANAWVHGRGWEQNAWSNPVFPTAAQLDAIVPDRPALLRHRSGHAAWANSMAMQVCGISAETPDPSGGTIQRDAGGNATGIFLETAIDLIADHLPAHTEAELVPIFKAAQQYCWEAGLTGIHDFDGPQCFKTLQTLHNSGDLGLRFVKNIPNGMIDHAIAVGMRSGFGNDWIRIGSIKMFADGALGPGTALMIEPYEDEPDNRGMSVLDKEEMMQIAHLAYANNLSLTTHAIGDRAVHDVLDVYESVGKSADYPKPYLRPRIEHVQIIHPDDKPRLAALDVIASMQPIHATSDMHTADKKLGDRGQHSYAIRTMLESGATVVFGSDAPIEPIDPLLGIHAAVTRQRPDGTPGPDGWYPEQRFSMDEAIHAFTMGAAITAGQQATQGSITPGKLADLTVWEEDLWEMPPSDLLNAKVAATMVDGHFKYRNF